MSNDSDFTACLKTYEQTGKNDDGLSIEGESWSLDKWSLDCGLDVIADGPRSVHVRLLDEAGYPSQTLSAQVVVDRQPPEEGTLLCTEDPWLVKLETLMLMGAVEADEMILEACNVSPDLPGDCTMEGGGLQPCEPGSDNYVPVNEWTEYTTHGCIRFKDEANNAARVKYRDYARNETEWIVFEFDSVSELELNWVKIPDGTFEMGCLLEESDCNSSELPVHSVSLSAFEMLETEVTEGQYYEGTGKHQSCNQFGPDYPVECVNWYDAKSFCKKVGGRLPTEAEWEYAARGGTTTKFYCGNNDACVDDIAWYDQNSLGHKMPVKSKQSNVHGLYDILGNVFEWTGDYWDPDYYPASPSQDPQGPATGKGVVGRGGSYTFDISYLRVSVRGFWVSVGSSFGGFRCVR